MFKITLKKSVAKDLTQINKDQVGNYKIIFAIVGNDTVLITRIKHRKESYK